jgi:glycerate 2-kinase
MRDQAAYLRHLRSIFLAGVARVDPGRMMKERVRLEGQTLVAQTEDKETRTDLGSFSRIVALGAGKAAAPMARILEEILGDRLDGGLITVKRGHGEKLAKIRLLEASHPVPDETSVEAAAKTLEIASAGDPHTLFVNLISGGGSALLCLPFGNDTVRLSLAEKQLTTRLLLECGATIQELNAVRKHISGIKGGRLAESMYPATSISLILSDVVGDRLDAIASGMTAADPTTFSDAKRILEQYGLWTQVPENVRKVIDLGLNGKIPDTLKKNHPVFDRVHNIILGSNYFALQAAAGRARQLGFNTVLLTSVLTGEAREAGRFLYCLAKDIKKKGLLVAPPACVIAGGETTVTIRGSGTGGRNQEMALAVLSEMHDCEEESEGIYFLSAGTDGNDGPTDAAGAFACRALVRSCRRKGLDPHSYLADNDSYSFFSETNGLLKTGPTNTNVADLQILIVV